MTKFALSRMLILIMMIIVSSCVNDSSKKGAPTPTDGSTTVNLLKATDITPPAFDEDTLSIITLEYTDVNGRKAQTCSLNTLKKVSVSQACACDTAGVCTVGIVSVANATGAASFRYNVAIGGEISSTGLATFSITALDDAPVASAITPASFKYNTQSIITLAYTDADSDKATACAISGTSNVSVTQACACNVSGVCTVGVTGTNNYIGNASFNYTVTANSVVSNSVTATLKIVGDPPVANSITPPQFPTNTQALIILSYTDAQSDQASSCSITSVRNVLVTQGCMCASGTCAVGVTSNPNYTGTADFKYTVTAAGQTSNVATANLTIIPSTPVANNINPAAFNEDVASIITLNYTDPLNRKASACAIPSTTNVTVNQACSCDAAGICTVGLKGTANYNGPAAFSFTVTAGGQVSNSALATLTINPIDDAPVVANATLMDLIYEDTQSGFLTLNYTDADGDRAGVNDCTISNPTNLSVTTPCACDVILGTCSLKITGGLHYYGAASFDYKIRANSIFSNVGTVNLTIIHKDHPPVSTNITPVAFNEDTQSVITLAYTDIDNDKAATCALTSLGNVTVTQACACNGAGVCTVGVTGTSNFNGAGSFYFTVTANGVASNSSTASFTINNVDDDPISAAITPPSFDQNTESIITLSYSDVDNDKASVCSISGLTNITETQACACDGAGVCTVGVTGTLNYSGAASFTYTVTANGVVSNSSTATLAIDHVNTAPSIAAISSTYGNENASNVVNFTIDDIDGPLACSTAVTVTSSSNTTLVPVASVNFSGAYPHCIATFSPTTNEYGSTNLTFRVTDAEGLFNSTTFTHNVRNGVNKTWLLGNAGDTNTYSFSSANIESVAPGVIRLTPLIVDQIDDSNDAAGFTALPTTLRWQAANNRIWQNHTASNWSVASGVYSTTYYSRIMDAKKSVSWNSLSWKSTLPFGKELTLTNESASDYSLTTGTLANGLIGLWHFNEGAGTGTVKNSKTGTNDNILVDAPIALSQGLAGKINMAAQFGGDSVIRSFTSAAVTPGSFTVSTWVKKTGGTSESVICFWNISNATQAQNCPVRISNVIRVRVEGASDIGSTTINDGSWHHILVYSNSLTSSTEVYIDGVLENFGTQPPNFINAGSSLYLGSDVGTNGSFSGMMDETAIWNRVLTPAEITEVYRRGANRLKMAFRTCTDSTCSTNPAWSSDISEADNLMSGEPLTTAPSFAIAPSNQRYFQYRTIFESDDLPTVSSPDIQDVEVGPAHYSYSTVAEEFVTQEGLSFKSLSNFVSTLGGNGCSGTGGGVRYQLSKDKINWSFYNGSAWASGTNFTTASSPAQLQAGLSTYNSSSPTASDVVYVRGSLKSDSDGANPCEVDQISLDGFE